MHNGDAEAMGQRGFESLQERQQLESQMASGLGVRPRAALRNARSDQENPVVKGDGTMNPEDQTTEEKAEGIPAKDQTLNRQEPKNLPEVPQDFQVKTLRMRIFSLSRCKHFSLEKIPPF